MTVLRSPVLLLAAALIFRQPVSTGLSIVLLVDVTSSHHSIRPPSSWGWGLLGGPPASHSKPSLWDPIQEFADALLPGDRAAIGGVANRLMIEGRVAGTKAEFVDAAWRVVNAADTASRSTTTPLWDAVNDTISLLETAPAPRAIILLTDGKATGNRLSTDEVARHAVASRVTVHIILGFDTEKDPEISPAPIARQFAEATGGTFASYSAIKTRGNHEIEGPGALTKQLMERLHKGAGQEK